MKFKDVKTLESILLEYGMKPGSSTSVSQQQSGASAKANAKPNTPKTPKSPTTSNTPKKPDQGSPTLGQEIEPQQPPQPVAKKASELELDTEYKNDKGDVVGKVVYDVAHDDISQDDYRAIHIDKTKFAQVSYIAFGNDIWDYRKSQQVARYRNMLSKFYTVIQVANKCIQY